MHSRRLTLAVALAITFAALPFSPRVAWGAPETRIDAFAVTPGRSEALPFTASHLGVRWKGDGTEHLELRWQAGDGVWSGWEHLERNPDMSANGWHAGGLAVTPGAAAVQARAEEGSPSALEVVAIDAVNGPRRLVTIDRTATAAAEGTADGGADSGADSGSTDTDSGADSGSTDGAADSDAGAGVAAPTVVRRAAWGADESLRKGTPSFAPISGFVAHHTVTSNHDPDPAATVRAIYSWHTQGNGWNDIGYNFLIDAKGRVYEGRYARSYAKDETPTGEDTKGRGVIGAHAAGNNTGSVGVALLGSFSDGSPTRAAVESLEHLLAWKADRHDVDPLATKSWSNGTGPTISGHGDVGATECPGEQLRRQLPAIRQNVADIIDAAHVERPTLGYRVLGRDTTVYDFGEAPTAVPTGLPPIAPASSIAVTPSGKGYWVLSGEGRVTPFGDATHHGSVESMELNAPPVRLEPTPTGKGYWILGSDGGVFSFGDAAFHGSTGDIVLNQPVIAMASTVDGGGYWLLAKDGGVFSFGNAAFHGSTGSMKLNAPVISMAPHPRGHGYWLQAEDGGIFSFGVRFHGSVPGLGITTDKAVQIRSTGDGRGYYVLNADGGIFTFGDAVFHGAKPGLAGTSRAVDLALIIGGAESETP